MHGVLVVVLLGKALVLQELGINLIHKCHWTRYYTTERGETVGLDLFDTVAVVLLVLVVVGVILRLGHLNWLVPLEVGEIK